MHSRTQHYMHTIQFSLFPFSYILALQLNQSYYLSFFLLVINIVTIRLCSQNTLFFVVVFFRINRKKWVGQRASVVTPSR